MKIDHFCFTTFCRPAVLMNSDLSSCNTFVSSYNDLCTTESRSGKKFMNFHPGVCLEFNNENYHKRLHSLKIGFQTD